MSNYYDKKCFHNSSKMSYNIVYSFINNEKIQTIMILLLLFTGYCDLKYPFKLFVYNNNIDYFNAKQPLAINRLEITKRKYPC